MTVKELIQKLQELSEEDQAKEAVVTYDSGFAYGSLTSVEVGDDMVFIGLPEDKS